MAKWQNDAVLEAALNYIADNGGRLDVCAGQPATFAEATGANSLGNVALTPGAGNGDFTIADGDVSGRKLTVAAQSGFNASDDGAADHVAITDGVDTLVYVTTISNGQQVTTGNPLQTAEFDIEFSDVS